MPVYTLASKKPLARAACKKAADAITDIHCSVTGAPPEFVNVVFMHGHHIRNGKALGIIGNVRKGGNRNKELTDDLRDQIHHGVSQATGIAPNQINCTLLGFPASWGMEGGEILPEPGEESEWLDRT